MSTQLYDYANPISEISLVAKESLAITEFTHLYSDLIANNETLRFPQY